VPAAALRNSRLDTVPEAPEAGWVIAGTVVGDSLTSVNTNLWQR